MSTRVKICGLTTLDDALDAIELGADYLGFNFYPDSKRFISFEKAAEIFQDIPTEIPKVGIFVNADPQLVIDTATELGIDILQFHGDEAPSYVNQFARAKIKAFRMNRADDLKNISEYETDFILVESVVENAYGGTGIVGNWDIAREAKKYGKIFLSGGLTPENVEIAVHTVKPFAVDVASGVESSPGRKDYRRMEEFIKRAKGL